MSRPKGIVGYAITDPIQNRVHRNGRYLRREMRRQRAGERPLSRADRIKSEATAKGTAALDALMRRAG